MNRYAGVGLMLLGAVAVAWTAHVLVAAHIAFAVSGKLGTALVFALGCIMMSTGFSLLTNPGRQAQRTRRDDGEE